MQHLSAYSAGVAIFSCMVMIWIFVSLLYIADKLTIVDENPDRSENRRRIKRIIIVHQVILASLLAIAIFCCISAPHILNPEPELQWIVAFVTPTPEPIRLGLLFLGTLGVLVVNNKLMKDLKVRTSVLASTIYTPGK